MRALPSRLLLVPLLLGAQAIFVHRISAGEHPPSPPALSAFPARFDDWNKIRETPIEPEVAQQLHADRLLNRFYNNTRLNSTANLFIAWFGSQRGGAQPHSPKVCLPGSGWIIESSSTLALATSSGSIHVNRMLVSDRDQRAVVLYWYQNPRRVITGEWEAKLWVVADAIRYKRTDLELVRVVVWRNGNDEETTREAARFASAAYPLLAGEEN